MLHRIFDSLNAPTPRDCVAADRDAIAAGCRQRVLENVSVDIVVSKTAALMRSLCNLELLADASTTAAQTKRSS